MTSIKRTSIHYGGNLGILAGLIPFGVGLFHYGQFIRWIYFHGPDFSRAEPHEPYIFFLASAALMSMGLGLALTFFLDRKGDFPILRGLVVFLLLWVGTHDLLVEFMTHSFPKPLVPIGLGIAALWMTRNPIKKVPDPRIISWGRLSLWMAAGSGGIYLFFNGLWRLWNIPRGIHDMALYPVMGHIAGANFMGVGAILAFFSYIGIYKQDSRFLKAFLVITGWFLLNDLAIFYFYHVLPLNPFPFLLSGMAGLIFYGKGNDELPGHSL